LRAKIPIGVVASSGAISRASGRGAATIKDRRFG
jgi:hypothetical protein